MVFNKNTVYNFGQNKKSFYICTPLFEEVKHLNIEKSG